MLMEKKSAHVTSSIRTFRTQQKINSTEIQTICNNPDTIFASSQKTNPPGNLTVEHAQKM